jgi:hypothetical protein
LSGSTTAIAWGSQATDKTVQGDYDADGKTDIAVWRDPTGILGSPTPDRDISFAIAVVIPRHWLVRALPPGLISCDAIAGLKNVE